MPARDQPEVQKDANEVNVKTSIFTYLTPQKTKQHLQRSYEYCEIIGAGRG